MKVKKAEITAFLSLIVVLLISFIFGIIEITVIQTEKNLSRICADGAIFSVFGEYESQLMEAYLYSDSMGVMEQESLMKIR